MINSLQIDFYMILLQGILTPMDEFQYWAECASSGRGNDRERAATFNDLFNPIAKVRMRMLF